jgi:hypothetical protein
MSEAKRYEIRHKMNDIRVIIEGIAEELKDVIQSLPFGLNVKIWNTLDLSRIHLDARHTRFTINLVLHVDDGFLTLGVKAFRDGAQTSERFKPEIYELADPDFLAKLTERVVSLF